MTPRNRLVPTSRNLSDKPSRVVLVQLVVAAGPGTSDWAVTPPLGNNLWLWAIDLWVWPTAANCFIDGLLKFTTGTSGKVSEAIVNLQWESIMDVSQLLIQGILWYCPTEHLHFDMRKFWGDQGRRFGVWMSNTSNFAYVALVAFHISEG